MAVLPILRYPDPRLRNNARLLLDADFNDDLLKLIADMRATMTDNKGLGLAATQVGVDLQVIVMKSDDLLKRVIINPIIVSGSMESSETTEGCLSVPDIFAKVSRPKSVLVSFQDAHGESHEINFTGLEATCVQHEIDHLIGLCFPDRLSQLKRDRIKDKLRKRK